VWWTRGKARETLALTPGREIFRALLENSMVLIASVAQLPFRSQAAPKPGGAGFHKRGECLPLSWGRGPG